MSDLAEFAAEQKLTHNGMAAYAADRAKESGGNMTPGTWPKAREKLLSGGYNNIR